MAATIPARRLWATSAAMRRCRAPAAAAALAALGASAVPSAPALSAGAATGSAERTDRPSSASRGQELYGEINERLARLVAQFERAGGSGGSAAAAAPAQIVATSGGKRVRLVTFDLDDTLWGTWAVLTKAHQVKQAYMEEHYPRIT